MALKDPAAESKETTRMGRGKKLVFIVLFALAAFVGLDGYYNRWGTTLSFLHWNTLGLTSNDGSRFSLKAQRDFELVAVDNPVFLLDPDSLSFFDRPYREAGRYRVYFRLSDSASARLQQLYESLSTIDTTGSMRRSIDDAKHAYGNLLRVLRIDTTAANDTLTVRVPDSSGRIMETRLLMDSDQEVTAALRTMVSKSPQLLVGVGLGLALSAGVDLLQGRSYLATADQDVFHVASLRAGTRTGEWQGKPIDVLWCFAPADSISESAETPDTSAVSH